MSICHISSMSSFRARRLFPQWCISGQSAGTHPTGPFWGLLGSTCPHGSSKHQLLSCWKPGLQVGHVICGQGLVLSAGVFIGHVLLLYWTSHCSTCVGSCPCPQGLALAKHHVGMQLVGMPSAGMLLAEVPWPAPGGPSGPGKPLIVAVRGQRAAQQRQMWDVISGDWMILQQTGDMVQKFSRDGFGCWESVMRETQAWISCWFFFYFEHYWSVLHAATKGDV